MTHLETHLSPQVEAGVKMALGGGNRWRGSRSASQEPTLDEDQHLDEILHFDNPISLRDRPPFTPDVRLRDGFAGQQAPAHQHQEIRHMIQRPMNLKLIGI